MQINFKTASIVFAIIVLLQFGASDLFANEVDVQTEEDSGSNLWCMFFLIMLVVFLSVSTIQLYYLRRERKFRNELVKFNDAFIHFDRDSSTLNGDLYETQHIKRLASFTSQVIETRNKALEYVNDNKELLLYHSTLIENVNDAIISTNMKHRIRSWNRAATKIFGIQIDDAVGKNLTELLNLKYFSTTQAIAYSRIMKDGSWEGELQYQKKNGETIFLLASISLIKSANKSHGFVGIYSNITKRKHTQKAYLESEKLFRTIFNNANIGNCIFDRNWKFEKVNKYLLDLLGYSVKELRKMTFCDVVRTKDWEASQETFKKLLKREISATRCELRVLTKAGKKLWVEVSVKPSVMESEDKLQIICSVVDINERKCTEKALRESGEKFKKIIDNLKDGFFRVDNDFRIILASPSMVQILGYEQANELEGRFLFDVIDDKRQSEKMMFELRNYGVLNNFRVSINRNSSTLMLAINATRWSDKPGETSGYEGLLKDITLEYKSQQALKESEAKYRTLVEDARIGITISTDDKVIFANNAFLQMMDYASTKDIDIDLLRKLNEPILHQNDTRNYDYFVDRNEERVHHEQDAVRSDGKIVSLSITSSIIQMNGEKCIQTTYVNNTKRKKAIEALRLSERKYRMLATNSSDVIWTMKTDLQVTYISPSIKNLLGYTPEEAIVGDIIKDIGGKFVDKVRSANESSFNSTEKFRTKKISYRTEVQVSKKDGSQVWLEVSINPLYDDNRKLTGILGSARDINDRKEAEIELSTQVKYLKEISECLQILLRDDLTFEEGLEKTLNILRQLFNTCRTYIYENYEDEKIGIYAVRKFLIQSERCKSKIIGSINRKIVFKNGYLRWKNTFMRGKPVKGVLADFSKEEQMLLKSQKTKSMVLIPLIIDSSWVGFIGFDETHYDRVWTKDEIQLMQTVADIIVSYIERKRARADLEKERERLLKQMDLKTLDLSTANAELSRAARLKDEFLANMSHELRTPLNAILGMSEALQEQIYGPMNAQELKTLKTIEESGQHLLELINDILDLSKIGVGKLTLDRRLISVESVSNASLRMVKQAALRKKIKIHYRSNYQEGRIYADERRLKQILVNLLTNAIKFTEDNKSVGFEVYADEESSKIDFTIWDEGMGINELELPNLFKPFVQLDSSLSRRHEGTGLGLSLVEKLTKMHCGSITLESIPDSGSKFTVSLPIHQIVQDKTVSKIQEDNAKLEEKSHNSMILHESSASVQTLVNNLQEYDISSQVHAQGEGVVEKIKNFKPNVILLDIILPDMTGWQVLRELKTNPDTKDIPVIVVSMIDEASKGLELGADCYLVKPVSKHQLILAIRQELPSVEEDTRVLLVMADKMTSLKQMYTVLIVDDNENNLSILMDSLISRNFRVLVARNGIEAVKRAKEDKPNLIIIEHRIPVLDGYQAIMRIREISELMDIPIIATSTLILPGDKGRLLTIGADLFMSKPIDLKILNANIDKIKTMNIPDRVYGE